VNVGAPAQVDAVHFTYYKVTRLKLSETRATFAAVAPFESLNFTRRAIVNEFVHGVPHRIPADAYAVGKWQRFIWSQADARELRRELVPAEPLLPKFEELERAFAETQTVCVHVKRSSWTRYKGGVDPTQSEWPTVTKREYFAAAWQRIQAQRPDARAVIVTDHPGITAAALGLPADSRVVRREHMEDEFQLLFAMSSARHLILSSTSFGWWVGWLSRATDRIVIVPSEWGALSPAIPPEWIQL
jgi:hypothetical protein